MEKPFEKLWMNTKQEHYADANIALANCPDDWSICSIVVSAWTKDYEQSRFVKLNLTKEETIKVRDALNNIIEDFGYVSPQSL